MKYYGGNIKPGLVDIAPSQGRVYTYINFETSFKLITLVSNDYSDRR
jgi:hypothetical protein